MTDSHTGSLGHQTSYETSQAKDPLHQDSFSQLETCCRDLINQGWSVDGILERLAGTVPEIATMLEAFKKQLEELDARTKEQDARTKEQDARLKEQEARLKKEQDARMKQDARLKKEQDARMEQDARLKEQEARLKKEQNARMKQDARLKKEQDARMKQVARMQEQAAYIETDLKPLATNISIRQFFTIMVRLDIGPTDNGQRFVITESAKNKDASTYEQLLHPLHKEYHKFDMAVVVPYLLEKQKEAIANSTPYLIHSKIDVTDQRQFDTLLQQVFFVSHHDLLAIIEDTTG